MNRRLFLERAAGAAFAHSLRSAAATLDLTHSTVILPANETALERRAAAVLVEETEKRSGLRWPVETASSTARPFSIYLNRAESPPEGFDISSSGAAISINAKPGSGLVFGVGKLLRSIVFSRQKATVDPHLINLASAPRFAVRGHQLGYRPKTNSYDGWNVATWDQYIRDLAIFGTNTIELIPPRSDDAADSPHFPLPPEQMMIQMSRIAASYGLAVSIWYPLADVKKPESVEAWRKEWAHLLEVLPRVDSIFIPGGDPGGNAPQLMFPFLASAKETLLRFHPKAAMWLSPQSFGEAELSTFFQLAADPAARWLAGVVYGPQSRLSLSEFRRRLPERLPIRLYPDITHSLSCQFPVADWDTAFALTEGREVINPRPVAHANIARRYLPQSIGFVSYSEGCNDDVNKFVWSALAWNPDEPVMEILREFSRYFVGAEGMAQGLLDLEYNWRGPLATNSGVTATLLRFQDLERAAAPAVLHNWRFQQALYRAHYDAYVRSRLLSETAVYQRALDLLSEVQDIGWTPEPTDVGERAGDGSPNGRPVDLLLEKAERLLREGALDAGNVLRLRVRELGAALYQSIQMQLAVNRYQGEAVERGANLETLDTPVTDADWLRARVGELRRLTTVSEQIAALKQLLLRNDAGPGGFYDELGNPSNRPHLVAGVGGVEDPEFRASALTGFNYPDRFGDRLALAAKRWAESLFDAALEMHYENLDSEAHYRLRVMYSGRPRMRVRLVANGEHEIHPFLAKPALPQPLEFDIPTAATAGGTLHLAWTREPGLGGNGRGCQVSEVWLIRI